MLPLLHHRPSDTCWPLLWAAVGVADRGGSVNKDTTFRLYFSLSDLIRSNQSPQCADFVLNHGTEWNGSIPYRWHQPTARPRQQLDGFVRYIMYYMYYEYQANQWPKPPFEAYRGNQPYAFVSYSHKDSRVVLPELQLLRRMGVRIWYDEGIDPGREWPDSVAEALDGCTVFVVFISRQVVESKNVRNEIHFALTRHKNFFAVHLEETILPLGLDLVMSGIQAIMKYRIPEAKYERSLAIALSRFPVLDNSDRPPELRISQTLPRPLVSLLQPAVFLHAMMSDGPYALSVQLSDALARGDFNVTDEIVTEAILDFLADRVQFFAHFPEALSEQVYNELAGKLPESRSKAFREAAVGVEPKACRFRRREMAEPISYRAHSNSVVDVSATQDLTLAATASHDNTVGVWDLKTALCLRRFDEPAERVFLSPDGSDLWTASWRNIRRWDPRTGELLLTIDISVGFRSQLSLSFDGRIGAVITDDGRMMTFHLSRRKSIRRISAPGREAWEHAALSRDGRWLYASLGHERIRGASRLLRVNASTGETDHEIAVSARDRVTCVATNWDGSVLLVGTSAGECRLYVAPRFAHSVVFAGKSSDRIVDVSISDNGRIAAVHYREPFCTELWEFPAIGGTPTPRLVRAIDRTIYLGRLHHTGTCVFVDGPFCGFRRFPLPQGQPTDYRGVLSHIGQQGRFSPDGRWGLHRNGVTSISSESLRMPYELPGNTYYGHQWASDDLILVQEAIKDDDDKELASMAWLWSIKGKPVVYRLQESGMPISAVAADRTIEPFSAHIERRIGAGTTPMPPLSSSVTSPQRVSEPDIRSPSSKAQLEPFATAS